MVLLLAPLQAKKPLQLLTRVGAEEGFNDTLGKSEGYAEGVIDNDGISEGAADGFADVLGKSDGAEEGFNDTLGKSEGYTEGVIDNDGTIETDGFDDGCFCRGKHISD